MNIKKTEGKIERKKGATIVAKEDILSKIVLKKESTEESTMIDHLVIKEDRGAMVDGDEMKKKEEDNADRINRDQILTKEIDDQDPNSGLEIVIDIKRKGREETDKSNTEITH